MTATSWDTKLDQELHDTIEAERRKRRVIRGESNARRRANLERTTPAPSVPQLPRCQYCGGRTARGLDTCRGHSDLPDLDTDLQARKALAA